MENRIRSFFKPGLVVFLSALFYLLYLIQSDIREYIKLSAEKKKVSINLALEEKKNKKLGLELLQLNSGDYIEGLARQRLGLIKPGETAYKIISKGGEN